MSYGGRSRRAILLVIDPVNHKPMFLSGLVVAQVRDECPITEKGVARVVFHHKAVADPSCLPIVYLSCQRVSEAANDGCR